jgi:hypothetical protein
MNSEKTMTKTLQTRANPAKYLDIGKKNCNSIPAINGISNRKKGATFQILE